MILYCVNSACDDPHYPPYLVGIFDSEEKAKSYISKQDPRGMWLNITEMELNKEYDT